MNSAVDALVQIVDAALASAVARSGPHLVCRPGCWQCCVGVFPIAQQDAARLRQGLALLEADDPARGERVRARVATSVARLTPWFPGDPASGILREDDQAVILFEEFANDEVCPVLDPTAGTCDLYAHRPILCRTFGPPMAMPADDGETNLGACELCFLQATTEEIAAAELDASIPEQEQQSDRAFDAVNGTHGETLVAFALRECASHEAPARGKAAPGR